MILVTVGMHTQPFDRLIRGMDEIAARTDEEVVMQIGHATYTPRHAQFFRFTTGQEMQHLYRMARVVVAHGGASAVEIIGAGTHLIAVPRLASFAEHLDDHQLDFVRAMERRGLVAGVYDIEQLEEAVLHNDAEPPTIERRSNLVAALRGYLDGFEEGSGS